jgi:hypothetical protein
MKLHVFNLLSFIILIFFASGCQWHAEKSAKDVEMAQDDTVKVKFTGEKKLYWENGKVKAVIQYQNGMREGINKNYSPGGELQSIVPFSNNLINGESVQYYPDGSVHSRINYLNGAKHGMEKWYYENGQLYQQSQYDYGKLEGKQMKYHKNGQLMSEAGFKDGQPGRDLKEYDAGGNPKKLPVIVVEEEDNIALTGEYIIRYRMSDGSKNAKFYAGELTGGTYFNPMLSTIPTINGVGKTVLDVKKGTFMMHTINVVATRKTYFRNTHIAQKKVDIAVENR